MKIVSHPRTKMKKISSSIPFTYLVGWSKTRTFYYGVRYASNVGPESLWESYFTSSNYVKQHRQENGEPDIIQIRRTFITKHDAVIWEQKVLRRLKVLDRNDFLNKALSSGKGYYREKGCKGHPHTEEHKQKMRTLMKQRVFTEEHRQRMSIGSSGKKASDETKLKMSQSQKGRVHSEETKAKMRAYQEAKRT